LDKNKTIPAPTQRISRDVLLEKTLSAAMGYSKSFPAPIRSRGARVSSPAAAPPDLTTWDFLAADWTVHALRLEQPRSGQSADVSAHSKAAFRIP